MKKNYFELLNLPLKLQLDHNELKKNYFNLLKEYSKDPVLDEGTENTKKKTLIEEAYQTLKDRITRIEHLLEVQGVEVANDNKAPRSFAPLAEKVEPFLDETLLSANDKKKLKTLHTDVISEFSSASIELARLETAWDTSEDKDLLRRLRRKSAAFSYIRNVEQNIRDALG